MTHHLPLLTNSAAKTFRRCAREFQIAYQLGIRPRETTDALRFGDLFHKAIEQWWLAMADKLAAALATIPRDADPVEAVRLRALLCGYDARWSEQPFETVAVERQFVVPLVNPATGAPSKTWELGGKIDAIARHVGTGELWVIEHKTASASLDLENGSLYWERLKIESQLGLYQAAARSIGFDVSGCIYDVIVKPAIRPLSATPLEARKYTKPTKKEPGSRLYAGQRDTDETVEEFSDRLFALIAEAPDRFFRRSSPIVRLASDVEDEAFDRWQIGRSIRDAQLANRWPRNTDACERYRRLCSYFSICSRAGSLDDETRFRKVNNVHEELDEATHAP